MNFDDTLWDRGCCAETLQISTGEVIILVTHMFETDTYRIERYINNKLLDEQHGLTKEEAEKATAQ